MPDRLPIWCVIMLFAFLNVALIGIPYFHVRIVFPLYNGVIPQKQYKRTKERYKQEWTKRKRLFLLPLLDNRTYKIYRVWFFLYILHIVTLFTFSWFEICRSYFHISTFFETYKRAVEIVLASVVYITTCTLEGILLEIPHIYSKFAKNQRIAKKESWVYIGACIFLVMLVLAFFIVGI